MNLFQDWVNYLYSFYNTNNRPLKQTCDNDFRNEIEDLVELTISISKKPLKPDLYIYNPHTDPCYQPSYKFDDISHTEFYIKMQLLRDRLFLLLHDYQIIIVENFDLYDDYRSKNIYLSLDLLKSIEKDVWIKYAEEYVKMHYKTIMPSLLRIFSYLDYINSYKISPFSAEYYYPFILYPTRKKYIYKNKKGHTYTLKQLLNLLVYYEVDEKSASASYGCITGLSVSSFYHLVLLHILKNTLFELYELFVLDENEPNVYRALTSSTDSLTTLSGSMKSLLHENKIGHLTELYEEKQLPSFFYEKEPQESSLEKEPTQILMNSLSMDNYVKIDSCELESLSVSLHEEELEDEDYNHFVDFYEYDRI